ncbi:MAG: tRNA (adenine-N1)-methyltransferase [Candidatus Helarchaeota archaeon]
MENNKIKQNDIVLIVYDNNHKWLIDLSVQKEFHTNKGVINCEDLIGKEFGIKIESSLGKPFYILKPTIRDITLKTKRKTQIIYPKDASFIIYFTGIRSGYRVLEAGVGSGALTLALAYYVSPNGKIYGYEKNETHYNVAKKNLEKFGFDKVVDLRLKDINDGSDEKNLDVIILDLADPWNIIPKISGCLKNSGYIVCYSPTTSQVEKTLRILKSHGFYYIHTLEILCRTWQPEYDKLRPNTRMIGHTGFITFAVKVLET